MFSAQSIAQFGFRKYPIGTYLPLHCCERSWTQVKLVTWTATADGIAGRIENHKGEAIDQKKTAT